MAGFTKDPAGNITANPFATGNKRFGAGQTNNATSGTLPKAGYQARDRKKKARSQAIQNILPKTVTGQQSLDAALDAKLGPLDKKG
jgi:hypothetical protein